MIKYFVITGDGQKYGPADVATLNNWIVEGRLQPHTMLQEENSSVQVEARGVPALKFIARSVAPPPPTAPPAPQAPGPSVPSLGNPYDTPRPMGPAQPQPFSSNYPRGGPRQGMSSSGQSGPILLGWLCTIGAPILIYFTFIGIFLVIWGFRAGFSLYQQGRTGQGVAMIAVNVLSAILWIGMRVMLYSGHSVGGGMYP